jgi:hypothetical protein
VPSKAIELRHMRSDSKLSCQIISRPENVRDIARVRNVYADLASSAASTKTYKTDLMRKLLLTNFGNIAMLSAAPRICRAG